MGMTTLLISIVLSGENPDGSNSIGHVIDAMGEYYVVLYGLSDRAPPLTALAVIGLEELASILPNGNRKFHFFGTKEELTQYLTAVDGGADVLKLVRPSSAPGP